MGKKFLCVLTLAVISCLLICYGEDKLIKTGREAGDFAADFTVEDINGEAFTLSEHKDTVKYLFFWSLG
ncbi:MAG: hypothetical protein ABII23_03610 [bacterium]